MRELKQKTTFPASASSLYSVEPERKMSFPFLRGIPVREGVLKLLTKSLKQFMYFTGTRFFKISPLGGMSEGQGGEYTTVEKAFIKKLCL